MFTHISTLIEKCQYDIIKNIYIIQCLWSSDHDTTYSMDIVLFFYQIHLVHLKRSKHSVVCAVYLTIPLKTAATRLYIKRNWLNVVIIKVATRLPTAEWRSLVNVSSKCVDSGSRHDLLPPILYVHLDVLHRKTWIASTIIGGWLWVQCTFFLPFPSRLRHRFHFNTIIIIFTGI